MSHWQELGDGVFRRRWDSRANHAQADELIEEIRLITPKPVTTSSTPTQYAIRHTQ